MKGKDAMAPRKLLRWPRLPPQAHAALSLATWGKRRCNISTTSVYPHALDDGTVGSIFE